jgi:hypothetical protein
MRKGGQDAGMSASSASEKSRRRRTASAARARPRSRAKSSGRSRRGLLLLGKLLPLVLVLSAFVAAFIFDPEAIMRLVWACVTGNFGARVQIAGAAVLLSVAAAMVWAFRPLPASVPGRDKSVRRHARRATSGKDASAAGIKPRDATNPPKRRTRNQSTAEAVVAPEAPEPAPKPANARSRSTKPSKARGEAKTSGPFAT